MMTRDEALKWVYENAEKRGAQTGSQALDVAPEHVLLGLNTKDKKMIKTAQTPKSGVTACYNRH